MTGTELANLCVLAAWILSALIGMSLHYRGMHDAQEGRRSLNEFRIDGSSHMIVDLLERNERYRFIAKSVALLIGILAIPTYNDHAHPQVLRFVLSGLLLMFMYLLDWQAWIERRTRAHIVTRALELAHERAHVTDVERRQGD